MIWFILFIYNKKMRHWPSMFEKNHEKFGMVTLVNYKCDSFK